MFTEVSQVINDFHKSAKHTITEENTKPAFYYILMLLLWEKMFLNIRIVPQKT